MAKAYSKRQNQVIFMRNLVWNLACKSSFLSGDACFNLTDLKILI